MALNRISYAQLLETNNLIQMSADETYWLCVTRTVQESKLFPVPAYMMLSYMMCYYRYPSLLRKIESRMSAEEIGDRARNAGIKIQNPSMGWALPGFYLLGREWLINLGLIRPQDAVEDLMYVMDFWKRFQLSWHRNNGHITNKEFGHRGQFLPERRLQVFHADMFDCKAGDELHEAAQGFMAAASQYGFLISCESRISLHNSGPYKLADDREMIVRDFMDLSESDFPWLDDVAKEVPYNNLTVTMAVKDCHFYLVDDWGSFESKPEFTSDKLVGVGLYTSDSLSDGYRARRDGIARGADRLFQDADRQGEGRHQQALAADRRLDARPDDRRRRDNLLLDHQGPGPCRRRLRRLRLDDGGRARGAFPTAVQRRIQPRRAGRALHRHAPVASAERIYDDAAFQSAAAALFADPLFDPSGRGLHIELRSGLSGREPPAAEGRPLQHDRGA